MTATATQLGFLGPGQLGGPMVERLVAAGFAVRVYARRPEVRDHLSAIGAEVVDTADAVTPGSAVVIACLFSDEQLREVAPGVLAAMDPGTVFASHVTGAPTTVRELAEFAASHQVNVVDAPLSGTDDDIRNARLTLLLGGEPAAVDATRAAFAAYANVLIPTGALGTALLVKLVNNLLFTAHVQLAGEAVRLGVEFGIGLDALTAALLECSAASTALRYLRAQGTVEKFVGSATPFLRKDIAAVTAVARSEHADLGLLLDVVRDGPFAFTD